MAQNQANFGISFNVNKSGLEQIKASLNSIKKMSNKDLLKANPNVIKTLDEANKTLEQIQASALEVDKALSKAFNSNLGTLNISKFNDELNKLDLNKIYQDFSKAGSVGQSAFRGIATELLTTNTQLKQTHSFLNNMATTMANTVKWNIASSAMNILTGSVQKAYGYVKNLDSSLNDIRIVTGASADQMATFAEKANSAAKALGRTTTDYTKASLIYYQQGLSEADVEARTQTTLKAANVTGQSADAVSEQLTAVWNGYKVAAEEAELYVDKLAAVATTTASDLEELSTGMSKVASAANAMGVDVDQLNAQLATIISVTRQAPESVGTALKTIYARMSDLKLGGTDEDGIGLGKVSGQMEAMGIHVLDASGNLRDMGAVIEEVAAKWDSWTEAEQTAMAQTMAGTRQYNNLVALFDNWDMYTRALEASQESMGTLQNQQDTYMEGTQAHLKQMTASFEDFYDSILDADAINDVTTAIIKITDAFTTFIDGIGGGSTVLTTFGALGLKVFSKDIAQGISTSMANFNNAKENAALIQSQIDLANKLNQVEDENVQKLSKMKSDALLYSDIMDDGQKETINSMIKTQNQLMDQKQAWEDNAKEAEKFFNRISKEDDKKIGLLNDDSDREKINLGKKTDIVPAQDLDTLLQYKQSLNSVIEETKKYDSSLLNLSKTLNDVSQVELTEDTRSEKYLEAMKQKIDATEEYKEVMNSLMMQVESGIENQEYSDDTATTLYQLMANYRNAVKMADGEITADVQDAASKVIAAAKQAAQAGILEAEKAEEIIRQAGDGIEEGFRENMEANENAVKKFFKTLKDQKAIQGMMTTLSSVGEMVSAYQSFSNLMQSISDGSITMAEGLSSIIFTSVSAASALNDLGSGLSNIAVAMKGSAYEGAGIIRSLSGITGASTKLVTGLGIAVVAITAIVTAYQHWKKAQEEVRQENIKKGEELAAERDEIQSLKRAYEDALTVYKQTGEGKEALLTATSNLSTALGLEAAYLTDAKNAWDEYSISVLEAQEANAKENMNDLEVAEDSAKEEMRTTAYEGSMTRVDGGSKMRSNTLSHYLDEEELSTLKNIFGDSLKQSGSMMGGYFLEIKNSGEEAYSLFQKIDEALLTLGQDAQSRTYLKGLWSELSGAAEEYKKSIDNVVENTLDYEVAHKTLTGLLTTPTNADELEVYQQQLVDILKVARDESKTISNLLTDEDLEQYVKDYTAALNHEFEMLSQQQEIEVSIIENIDEEHKSAVEEYLATLDQRVIDVIIRTVWEGATEEDVQDIANAATLEDEINTMEQNASEIQNIISQISSGDIKALTLDQQLLVDEVLKTVDGFNEGLTAYEEFQNVSQYGSFMQSQYLTALATEGKLIDGLIDKKIELNKTNIKIKESEQEDAIANAEKARDEQEAIIAELKDDETLNIGKEKTDANLREYALENNTAYQDLEKDAIKYENQVNNCIVAIENLNKEQNDLKLEKDSPELAQIEAIAQYNDLLNKRVESISGTYNNLSSGSGSISAEDATLLSELETMYPALAEAAQQYADEGGRFSKEYLETLREIQSEEIQRVQTEKENNITRLNDIQTRIEARKTELEAQKESLEIELEAAKAKKDEAETARLQSELDETNKKLTSLDISDQRSDAVEMESTYIDTSNLEETASTFEHLNNLLNQGIINVETYTEKTAELFGLEPSALKAEIDMLQELNPELADNAELATDIAKANLRCERGTKDLSKVWDKYSKALQDWTKNGKKVEDYTDDITGNTETVEDAFKDLFDLTDEEFKLLPDDFIENHQEELGEVVKGTEGAYENMQDIVEDELIYRIALDQGYSEAQAAEIVGYMGQIQTMLDGMELKAGVAIDDADFIAACNNIIAEAGMTESAVTAAFDAMNCDVKFVDAPAEEEETPQYGSYYVPADYAPGESVPTGGEDGTEGEVKEARVVTAAHFEQVDSGSIKTVRPGARAIETITPRGGSKGGNISRKAAPAGGGSGGGGKKGGGGGKGSAPKKTKARKKDYYHNVNNSLQKLSTAYDKLAEVQDKTFGQKHIDNIKKTNENLDKQIDKMRERIKIANEQEKVDLKKKITKNYKDVKFNKNGTIKNYESILSKYYKKYQNAKTQDAQDKAKEKYDDLKELLDNYETLILETTPDWEAEVREKIDERYENMIHQFEYEIEMRINWGETDRDVREFFKDFNGEVEGIKTGLSEIDFEGLANFEKLQLNSFINSEELTSKTRQIGGIIKEIKKIDDANAKGYKITNKDEEKYFSDIYGDNKQAALEDLKERREGLMKDLKSMKDARDNAYDTYLDAIDDGIEKMDKHIEQYEIINEEISHNMNLIEMLYGETSDMMEAQYDLQEANYLGQLKSLKTISDTYKTQLDAEKAAVAAMEASGDTTSQAYADAKERVEIYEDAYNESVSNLQATTKEAVQNLIDKYAFGVKQILDNMANSLFDSKDNPTFNTALTEWELMNKESEMYLDNINAAFEIQKLESKYKDALNSTDSITAQKKLNGVMESELGMLREKDKLSQYEIDHANLIYELTLKQIALEEAQQNKSKMRLRRDAQGNYSYQFTADTESINKAQEDVNDVLQQLTNLSQEKGKEIYDTALNETQNFIERMAEIEAMADGEEKERLKALTQENYNRVMTDLMSQSELVEQHIGELVSGPLAEIMEEEKQLFDGDEGISTKILSLTKTLRENIAGKGGMTNIVGSAMTEIKKKSDAYHNSLKQIEDTTGKAFEKLSDSEYVEGIKNNISNLTSATDSLAGSWKTTLDNIKLVIEEMDKALAESEKVQAALNAVKVAEEKEKTEYKAAGDAAEKANITAVADPVPEPTIITNNNNKDKDKKDDKNKNKNKTKTIKKGGKINAKGAKIYDAPGGTGKTQYFKNDPKYKVLKISGNWVQARYHKLSSGVSGWFKKSAVKALNTGGYTGDWNSNEGRIALLHKKELVLNQKDTKNILDAVNIIRGLGGLLQNSMVSRIEGLTQSLNGISIPTVQNNPETGPQSVEQTVHITAEFPGATEVIQIEQALENLVSRASQYAFRRKE